MSLPTALALASAAALLPMAAIALWNVALAPRLHRLAPAPPGRLVSVLVPARDEAANLRRLLPALLATRYAPLEILVLDDESRDESAAVVRGFAASDDRIRLVEGLAPPDGWSGKNWACHQLFHHADGDLLLFCDADVVPGPDAVGRTVTALHRADAVTAFPRHEAGGWFEEAVVPLVAKLPVVTLLPLALVRRTRTPALAVGNGQWFAWRRPAYVAAGGHRGVRGDVLDDVGLARRAKAAGVALTAVLGTRDLAVRMYRARDQVWDGFAKNLYPLVGGRPWTLALAGALWGLTMLVPLALPLLIPLDPGAAGVALLPLALLLAVRTLAALALDDPARSVALHPVGAVAVVGLALDSWRRHRSGRVTWKRRLLIAGERT